MALFWKSLLAALLIILVDVANKRFGAVFAGIVGLMPMVGTISYVVVTSSEKTTQQIQHFVEGAGIGLLFWAPFLAVLWVLAKYPQTYWLNLILAYVAWGACVFIWFLRKY